MENTLFDISSDKSENISIPGKKSGLNGSEDLFYPNLKFLIIGILFGIVLIKGEIVSWYRIQEMFRFQSFHMYGIIGSAVGVGMISINFIKRFKIKTISKEEIIIKPKKFHKGYIFGGILFGFGWAITGACPGPLFAQIGTGTAIVIITLCSAILGTWTYGLLKDRLPH